MFLQLISIPGCDNKTRTISVWPLYAANNKGVISNIWNKFGNWLQFEISFKKIGHEFC